MRNIRMDNLRALLIFLVVFGHFTAWIPGAEAIYRIIYLFHMPAFLFLTGYFSRFSIAKILTELAYPYALFQVLYLTFDTVVLKDAPIEELMLQFTTPYWLLWYLLATIFYRLLIPLLDKIPLPLRPLTVAGAVGLALACGYVPEFGYYLSAGRFFAFLPFFLSGYYLSRTRWFPRWLDRPLRSVRKWPFALAGIAVSFWSALRESVFTPKMLYGSVPYAQAGFGPVIRLIITLSAFGWILMLLVTTPNRSIPGITVVGRGTLPIFLLHGFLVRLLARWQVFSLPLPGNLLLALLLTAAVLALLGNRAVQKPMHRVLTGGWLEKLWRKYVMT